MLLEYHSICGITVRGRTRVVEVRLLFSYTFSNKSCSVLCSYCRGKHLNEHYASTTFTHFMIPTICPYISTECEIEMRIPATTRKNFKTFHQESLLERSIQLVHMHCVCAEHFRAARFKQYHYNCFTRCPCDRGVPPAQPVSGGTAKENAPVARFLL